MALHSMTGFGTGEVVADGMRIRAELATINRKQLDIAVSFPRIFMPLEPALRKTISARVSRGRVSGQITIDFPGTGGGLQLNRQLARQIADDLRETAAELGMDPTLSADSLLRIPNILEDRAAGIAPKTLLPPAEKALNKALDGLIRMRRAEGRELESDLRGRLNLLEEKAKSLQKLAPSVVPNYRARLLERLGAADLGNLQNDERVLKEIALFADRSDVTEEITRIFSHIGQVRKLLRSTDPSGRALDFLAQELFREINTTGSKANDLAITEIVVAFKTELERFREQVQNVE